MEHLKAPSEWNSFKMWETTGKGLHNASLWICKAMDASKRENSQKVAIVRNEGVSQALYVFNGFQLTQTEEVNYEIVS